MGSDKNESSRIQTFCSKDSSRVGVLVFLQKCSSPTGVLKKIDFISYNSDCDKQVFILELSKLCVAYGMMMCRQLGSK